MNCPQAPALTEAPSHPGFLCFKVSLVHHCIPYIVVQLLSHVQLLATLWTAACQVSLSFTTSQSLHQFSSVQFSCSVVSNCLQPHGLQHARPPCPSPTPGVHPNSYSLSRWCHPTISSSVGPFSSCPQSFPASGSFPMSQLFASGSQSIGVSASTSVLPMNTQDWSPLGWTGSGLPQ